MPEIQTLLAPTTPSNEAKLVYLGEDALTRIEVRGDQCPWDIKASFKAKKVYAPDIMQMISHLEAALRAARCGNG